MASWSELLGEYAKNINSNPPWLDSQLHKQLGKITKFREPDTVVLYASSFLQNPSNGSAISPEDINGFMNALHGIENKNKGLTLILHTPGGNPNAVESIVEYLHSKFTYIEVIVPYLAMSGGSMISLASDLLVLGKQSQLGPIDPQIYRGNKMNSARAIQEGFNKARKDIESNLDLAHFWAPILQNMGPSLFVEAEKALSYSKELVTKWLNKRMFKDITSDEKRNKKSNDIAAYFNAEDGKYGRIHMHGQRIGIEKLTELGVRLESFEDNQELQDCILTIYHLMTLIFEMTGSIKFITNNKGKMWVKKGNKKPI